MSRRALALSKESAAFMTLSGGSGWRSGRSEEFIRGANVRFSRRARVRSAMASTGRWIHVGGEGREGFELSGITLGSNRVQRERCESGARNLRREGIDLYRRADAGLI